MIVDTSILYALANADDVLHEAARDIMRLPESRIVPEAVAVETDFMILTRLGVDAEIEFLTSLSEGTLVLEPPLRADRVRAAELVRQYKEAEIGYVDAMIVATAERLNESMIATGDHRHFRMIRPNHVTAFTLVPDQAPK